MADRLELSLNGGAAYAPVMGGGSTSVNLDSEDMLADLYESIGSTYFPILNHLHIKHYINYGEEGEAATSIVKYIGWNIPALLCGSLSGDNIEINDETKLRDVVNNSCMGIYAPTKMNSNGTLGAGYEELTSSQFHDLLNTNYLSHGLQIKYYDNAVATYRYVKFPDNTSPISSETVSSSQYPADRVTGGLTVDPGEIPQELRPFYYKVRMGEGLPDVLDVIYDDIDFDSTVEITPVAWLGTITSNYEVGSAIVFPIAAYDSAANTVITLTKPAAVNNTLLSIANVDTKNPDGYIYSGWVSNYSEDTTDDTTIRVIHLPLAQG